MPQFTPPRYAWFAAVPSVTGLLTQLGQVYGPMFGDDFTELYIGQMLIAGSGVITAKDRKTARILRRHGGLVEIGARDVAAELARWLPPGPVTYTKTGIGVMARMASGAKVMTPFVKTGVVISVRVVSGAKVVTGSGGGTTFTKTGQVVMGAAAAVYGKTGQGRMGV